MSTVVLAGSVTGAVFVLLGAALTAAASGRRSAIRSRAALALGPEPGQPGGGRRQVPPRSPSLVVAAIGAVGLIGAAVWALVGTVGLLIAAVGVGVGGRWMRSWRRGADDRRLEAQVADALDSVTRNLESGSSLRDALRATGERSPAPIGPDLTGVVHEAELGVPLREALASWSHHRRSPSLALAVTALDLAAGAGGSEVRALAGVSATVRDRRALDGEVRALATQARVSAAVLVIAPVGFAAVVAVSDPETSTFLLRTGPGLACLMVGGALNGLGAWWMRHLTRSVQ